MFCGTSLQENSVKYLLNISNDLSPSNTSTILKSYYITKVRKLTSSGAIGLPQANTKSLKTCSYCSVSFTDDKPSYHVQPERKQNKFIKRLLKKGKGDEVLTRYQAKYLKNLQRKGHDNPHNKLVIKCRICQKETRKPLLKPKKKIPILPETPVILSQKKKKKKRDIFTGLNKEAVLSVTPQNHSQILNSNTSKIQPTNLQNKILFDKKKATPSVITQLNTKHKKKNTQNMQNLKNILSSKKSKGSSKLKEFLTSI